MRCVLKVLSDGKVVCQTILGPGDRVAVGRSVDADLALGIDPSLSRLHFEVVGTPAGFLARDLGSSNGLITGGKRVTETLLEHGQVLRAGTTDFYVSLAADDDSQASTLDPPNSARPKPTDSEELTALGLSR